MGTPILPTTDEYSIGVYTTPDNPLSIPRQFPLYSIILISGGSGEYKADFGNFMFNGPTLFFSTPLQSIQIQGSPGACTLLQFHGDYYCIEYHKQEVACNGVLFNNIYSNPTISLSQDECQFFERITQDIRNELKTPQSSDAIVTAYLQLILAKATSIKGRENSTAVSNNRDELMEKLRSLIEENFIDMRKPAQYAEALHISPDTLSKRCKQYFSKTPTELIHERIALEAKKGLHLTRKSIKEIAHGLKFQDEHYFSRFFKKITKVTPLAFRQKTGISVVANSSSLKPE